MFDHSKTPTNQTRRWPKAHRVFAYLAMTLALALVALPGQAQNLTKELDRLKREHAEVQQRKETQKQQVNSAATEAERLTREMEIVNIEVNAQTALVAEAERRLEVAETQFLDSQNAVDEMKGDITDLEEKLSARAITSFVGREEGRPALLTGADPSKAVRMKSLVEAVTDDDLSLADELKAVREDLEIERAVSQAAREEARGIREELAAALAELEAKQAEHQKLAAEAEAELERQLAEAAALADLEQEVSAQIVKTNQKLAEQAALATKRSPAPRSSSSTSFTSASEIVKVEVFWVHRDIADNLQAMLDHAASEGHRFTGGGYRDPASQVRLRKAHCGSSNYAIYHMPSSQCRPPTARPGRSMHEQGKALDLQHNGVFIASRSNTGFKWLSANAATYGFYNLPSEPWHWSVNGN